MSDIKSFWYLGSPYSGFRWGRDEANRLVCVEAGRLVSAGIRVFSPIAHFHAIAAMGGGPDPRDYHIWWRTNLPFMEAACGLIALRMEDWETSVGLVREWKYFSLMGKPIVPMDPGVVPTDFTSVI